MKCVICHYNKNKILINKCVILDYFESKNLRFPILKLIYITLMLIILYNT